MHEHLLPARYPRHPLDMGWGDFHMNGRGIETHSATWRAVKGWAEEQIGFAQVRLEASGTDHASSEAHRARIRTLRELLKLPEPEAPPPVTHDTEY
jgi:hypothetical protein